MADARGCPVAVSVYEGNTSDPQTLMPEIDRLRNDFGIAQVVMVGDRGMISQKAINTLREQAGIDWITALKSGAIRKLIDQGHLQLDLFDERLNRLAEYARERIREAIGIADVPVCVTGAGSMFRVHMKAGVPDSYREAYVDSGEAGRVKRMLDHLFENGIIMINTCSGVLSTPMTETEIDTLAEAMLGGFRKLR